MRFLFLSIALIIFACIGAAETQQTEAEIQARVDAISKTLRCVVCQNQSIYESNAPLAEDMRRTVEQRVRAGDTDDEVRDYLRGPYGDFILMRPPFQLNTLILWLGPVFFIGCLLYWYASRNRHSGGIRSRGEFSDDDRKKLNEALWGAEDPPKS